MLLFDHWVYFWHAFRSDPLCPGFLWVFCVALGLIYKRIKKVLSNWYKKYFAIWKLILWASFSATLHYHKRILASARKQRTKKSPKIDPLYHRRPYTGLVGRVYFRLKLSPISGRCPQRLNFFQKFILWKQLQRGHEHRGRSN